MSGGTPVQKFEQINGPAYIIEHLTPKAAAQSAKTIASIYRDVWIETYPNPDYGITKEVLINHFADFENLVDDWHTKLADRNRSLWVSKNKDKTVTGFCVSRKDINFNELEYIYIRPEYQAGGIGRSFMEQALKWMGDSKPIILYGAAYNDKAIRFYQKYGFKLSEERTEPKKLNSGVQMPVMKMIRPDKN